MKKYVFLISFLLFLSPVFAQQVSNVSFEVFENRVEIYYDLSGKDGSEFEVSLSLKRDESSGFVFVPKTVVGQIGKNIHPGKKKKVVWEMKKDYHIDPEVADYYFEVLAKEKSSSSFWYYVAGTVLAGGGAAAILLSKKKDSPAETAQSIGAAPDRP
ncbi:MAG: hypothetical protein COW85_15735 [Ignavibacteria bacterium CG22_combo_CG10-13_8_21_14_all_37_15]|nr:MAG: hypothetical protein COW85_15735 [Ignavibacteria bacterium CG22_combo_CG10-13_8_21_14_all_37_15]